MNCPQVSQSNGTISYNVDEYFLIPEKSPVSKLSEYWCCQSEIIYKDHTSKESINSLDPRSLNRNLEVTLYSISSIPACRTSALLRGRQNYYLYIINIQAVLTPPYNQRTCRNMQNIPYTDIVG